MMRLSIVAIVMSTATAFTVSPRAQLPTAPQRTSKWSSQQQRQQQQQAETLTVRTRTVTTGTQLGETKQDLERLAVQLNPIIGYFDPLDLVERKTGSLGALLIPNFILPQGMDNEALNGWLRQSEIKHGRVAMAAFVGYCVQSVWTVPWAMTLSGEPFPSPILVGDGGGLSPPEQWDAIPKFAKLQILGFIGFLEWYSELSPSPPGIMSSDIEPNQLPPSGQQHYTKGGKPGQYPTFDAIPHAVPWDLYDPFNLSTNMDEEMKERRLRSEINNGRLAMIGITGFLCEQTIPGSVPVLRDIVVPYTGNLMVPFEADFSWFS